MSRCSPVRHYNYRAQIDTSVSPVQDSQFKMVSGLAGSTGVSFEAVNFPGYYLRARANGEVWLDANDSTTAFANEATFRRVAGLANAQKSSYQTWTDSTRYLRHSNYKLFVQSASGSIFNEDATFNEISP